MQKTFLKFVLFELTERISRFERAIANARQKQFATATELLDALQSQVDAIKTRVLEDKAFFNNLFTDSGKPVSMTARQLHERLLQPCRQLVSLTPWLLRLENAQPLPETHLFLKDVLPDNYRNAKEFHVFLNAEPRPLALDSAALLVDTLPVLQQQNPLAWVGLTGAFARRLTQESSAVESFWLEHFNGHKQTDATAKQEVRQWFDQLVTHAVNLRLLGPAYYFHAVTEATFQEDRAFFSWIEPALFYGLNHLNFVHKTLVILHEACERSREFLIGDNEGEEGSISKETLSELYRVVEQLVPSRYAFQEKHFERALQLQERLAQGVLLSSSPLFPIDDVAEKLCEKQREGELPIYEMLAMMTEYPQTPREIVNAGWLHKVERGPVWLYSAVNEDSDLKQLGALLEYQDHLLAKSIETSEIHRVLLCSA